MKRIISMGFAALVILSALVILDIGPIRNVRASGDPVWNGSFWETTGDWVVDGSTTIFTYTTTTIVVNGNLTIDPGFTLTLQNVTLIMNSPYNGAYNITVRASDSAIFPGGNLTIENVGANPSVITNNGTGQFGFHVEAMPMNDNGNLWMRNSKLLHCGWDQSEPDYSDGGLWIAGDATVEYSDISEGYAGIVVYGGDNPIINPTIQYNTIHDNPMGAGIYLTEVMGPLVGEPIGIGPGNDINTCYWGVFIETSSNMKIHNNSLHDNGLGGINDGGGLKISEYSTDIYIEDNNITANWQFNINGYNSANIFVYRNEVNGSTNFTSFETIDGLDISNNYFCQGGANVSIAYLFGYDITDCIIDNNVVNNNMGIGALFNYVQVEITDNRFENNPSIGIGLQLGSYNSIIDGNKIINNSDIGLFLVGNNITIRNNEIRNNGDGTFLMGMPDFQDSGFCALNSYDIYLYDNELIDNVQTTGSDEVDGVYLYGSEITTSVYMWNNTMNKNQYNLHCRGGVEAYDINSTYIKNTSFVDSYEVYLEQSIEAEGPNHVTFLNTTFDNSSVYIEAGSDHTVQWYKHIKVEDNLGNPIPNASIWTNDSFGNNEGASGATTDTDGRLKFIPLTEYVENATTRTLHTPHSIDVIDPTRVGYDEANMWHSHFNTIVLNERPTVTDLRTEFGPTGSVYRTNTITIIMEGSDLEDNNLDLIPYIEYRVNETSPWIDETSPYFGSWNYDPGNSWWTITFTPPADASIDTYGFRARLEDSYPSYSDWYVVDGMVDVLNNPPLTIWVGEGASTVYRGNSVYVYADGDDIEDNGEDDTWDAQCEYRLNGSSSWTDTYISQSIWDSPSNHWRFTFEPPATRPDPNHGPVDFRVRFMDSDGTWNNTWYTMNDLVHVLNNIPMAQNLEPGYFEVYRGESIWIFANASDLEQSENSLVVEFWWDAPGGGEIWEQNYLGSVQWDSGGFFKVEFTPDQNAVEGYYNFRVRITDTDGDYNEMTESGMVNVMNQPPVPLSITPSAPTVRAGADYIYLYINASDYEDIESDLTVTVQWQYNETGPQGWSGAYITAEPYEGSAPSGWLKVRFTPDSNMQLGRYDFRAKVEDTDGDESVNPKWIAIYRAVEIQNPEPTLENVALGDNEVYRNQTLYIFLNASDLGEPEPDLTPEMEWLSPGGFWTDTNLMMFYEDTNGNLNDDIGYWVIEFTPPITATLGEYQFKTRVRNSAGGISNGGDWETGSKWTTGNTADVLNNEPTAIDLWVEDSTVTRGDYIFIWADGVDLEDDSDDLIPHFEYREEGGLWDDSYLTGLTYFIVEEYWRSTFSPPADPSFSAGLYDFRVWFEDMDGDISNIMQVDDMVEVLNVPPVVDDFTVPSSAYRLETIYITANGSDSEHNEGSLTAIFEYKGPSGNWMAYGAPGGYFQDSPVYISGFWRIPFIAPTGAEIGDYSFRVQFADDVNTSGWTTMLNTLELMNNNPEVEIESPLSGEQTSITISFSAEALDLEDTQLNFSWDFGDGETSTLESPTRTYTNPGTYVVEVLITDSDGSEAIDTVTITLNESLFNEVPIVDDLTVPPTSYRLKVSAIVAEGSDADGSEVALTPEFQYKDPLGGWTGYGDSGSYFQDPPEYSNGHWVILFSPPADAPIGQYSFKVRFSDDYSTSGWLWKNDTLTMINNAPEVVDFAVPSSGYRFEAIYISANGSDDDGSEYALTPSFQYKEPHDSNWISYGDSGSYFTGSPQYANGYWRIEFTPPAEADLGLYSFRVQFADDYHSSQWYTKLDSFTLNNNLPTVQIIAPSQGEQSTSSITFMATPSDIEDSTLTFQWDFGDGSGLLSTEESPTYNYSANGTYTVSVTVTDSDGGSATDTISIIIPEIGVGDGDGDGGDGGDGDGDGGDGEDGTGEPGEKDEEEDLMKWLFLLIIIILVGIILLLLLMRKMRYIEEIPQEPEVRRQNIEPEKEIPSEEVTSSELEEEAPLEITDEELPAESPRLPEEPTEE